MLAKAVVHESHSTFLIISAASLTLKYIDQVDCMLSEKKDNEHEATRRLKTVFLVEFYGLYTESEERNLVMGATNRSEQLDNAALRRFTKRVYVTLSEEKKWLVLLEKVLRKQKRPLSIDKLRHLPKATSGYLGSDLMTPAKDAALGPLRKLNPEQVRCVDPQKM
ncbi:hypothetical protein HPB51_007107 [Rhipicephalus microplus]|uniref:ATPase AAA-type core domain-containing protein n=1 Tax=Rhipicephalus microplus TaxID=6941 RepID=A0A9J6DZY1_RHIMP|nr:hypothetical protein HPB51_007107 [Rhipicephalus microplus]